MSFLPNAWIKSGYCIDRSFTSRDLKGKRKYLWVVWQFRHWSYWPQFE
jgi:hypothetical protein